MGPVMIEMNLWSYSFIYALTNTHNYTHVATQNKSHMLTCSYIQTHANYYRCRNGHLSHFYSICTAANILAHFVTVVCFNHMVFEELMGGHGNVGRALSCAGPVHPHSPCHLSGRCLSHLLHCMSDTPVSLCSHGPPLQTKRNGTLTLQELNLTSGPLRQGWNAGACWLFGVTWLISQQADNCNVVNKGVWNRF